MPESVYRPQVNDGAFVLREKPDKLHGHYEGPYLVLEVLSPSSLLVINPVSGSFLRSALQLVKPCLFSLPSEILDAYVAADFDELISDAIVDVSDDTATVVWSDGTTTAQPVSSIRNTAAYSRYIKLCADSPKTRRKRKRSDNNLFDSRRGDLIVPFVDSFQVVVDFTTVDPFVSIYHDDVLVSSNGHLNKAEVRKRNKDAELLNDLNRNLYSKFSFVPFAFSIYGKIGQSGLNFFNDFDILCRSNGKNVAGY
ncbi:hypothetical protein P9112_001535 [Eukaryota sp. TZLM1-RC]